MKWAVWFSVGCVTALGALGGCGSGGGEGATGGSGAAGKPGGSGGAGGGAAPADASGDATVAGLVYLYDFSYSAQIAAAAVSNTADTDKNDLGVYTNVADGGVRASTSWDGAVGSPGSSGLGSLEIQLPTVAYGQFVDYQFNLSTITDMGRRTLSLWLRLDSGFDPAGQPGSVLLYAKSGDNWDWGQAATAPLDPAQAGQWVQFTYAMNDPGSGSTPAFDPGYVKAVGIRISTGTGTGAAAPPTPAVFHLDSIGYQ
jgi:hypothetical protein